MKLQPDFETFRAGYDAGHPQVVWATLIADLETPVSAFLKLAEAEPFSFLFESVEGGTSIARYSFITLKPDLIWRCRKGRSEINRRARLQPEAFEPQEGDPLENLRRLTRECQMAVPEHLPPMAASLIGYAGYDMVRLMQELPDKNPDVLGVPESIFVRPTVTAVFDRVEDLVTIISPVWPTGDRSAEAAYELACERLAEVASDFERSLPYRRERREDSGRLPEASSSISREAFLAMVRKAKAYIAAGDVRQVVLAQRFAVPFTLPPFMLYRALRRLNPSPFLFFLNFGGFAVVGSSPEVLVRLRDGVVTIRPLAGTRKRGATPDEDRALAEELLADPKERAEHRMLLDLGREDVGRVAQAGSVEVAEEFVVERYSHVMHISSTVDGQLDKRYDAIDALVAGFPAGTVSGAPKGRAMEIIEELEPDRRAIYAGAVGYFGADGDMDTCIALRTALVKDGMLYIQAGAGVVAESDPEAEYRECQNKARALIRAAEEALRFARQS